MLWGQEVAVPVFKKWDVVAVPCDVRPGAFPGEFLVTTETVNGPISGLRRGRGPLFPPKGG